MRAGGQSIFWKFELKAQVTTLDALALDTLLHLCGRSFHSSYVGEYLYPRGLLKHETTSRNHCTRCLANRDTGSGDVKGNADGRTHTSGRKSCLPLIRSSPGYSEDEVKIPQLELTATYNLDHWFSTCTLESLGNFLRKKLSIEAGHKWHPELYTSAQCNGTK